MIHGNKIPGLLTQSPVSNLFMYYHKLLKKKHFELEEPITLKLWSYFFSIIQSVSIKSTFLELKK